MENLKEILKQRATWIIILLIIAIIIIWYVIKKRKQEKHELSFADMVRQDALKNKVTEKEMELNQYMRKLWGENTTWVRNYVISYVNNSSDMKDVTRRLLHNQEQIGKSLGLWYGDNTGKDISKMLQKNLISFGDVLKEMVDKNPNAAMVAEKQWNDNTEKLVSYLSKLNKEWDNSQLSSHLKKYNDLNIQQAMNKLKRKHQDEIKSFDDAHNHSTFELADFLTAGIIKQHPDKFDKIKTYKSDTEKTIETISEEDSDKGEKMEVKQVKE